MLHRCTLHCSMSCMGKQPEKTYWVSQTPCSCSWVFSGKSQISYLLNSHQKSRSSFRIIIEKAGFLSSKSHPYKKYQIISHPMIRYKCYKYHPQLWAIRSLLCGCMCSMWAVICSIIVSGSLLIFSLGPSSNEAEYSTFCQLGTLLSLYIILLSMRSTGKPSWEGFSQQVAQRNLWTTVITHIKWL